MLSASPRILRAAASRNAGRARLFANARFFAGEARLNSCPPYELKNAARGAGVARTAHSAATAASAALLAKVAQRDAHQPEFLQAFAEVLHSLEPVFEREPRFLPVLETLAEPERQIVFRVPWLDDQGERQFNRGFRVQFSSALGPYKGGLRFHPTVNLSVMKFLGFEQIFKNALTGLALGAAKGGSDFDPRGKSEAELMRFCQSFMIELHRHIGQFTDVPAGDINVGAREIGYLFGQYKRLVNSFESGTLTGKSPGWGGSLLRPEATGYGCVYFAESFAKYKGLELRGARCLVSGSGNVAQHTVEKLLDLGAVPVTMSDSDGYVYEPGGFTRQQLAAIKRLKSCENGVNGEKGRLSEYAAAASSTTARYVANAKPWAVEGEFAFPCATQNEIGRADAEALVEGGCKAVCEGANMPTDNEAIELLREKGVALCPAKAANAGGVAVSGLEMAQNAQRARWTRAEVDTRLREIMQKIFDDCVHTAREFGREGDLQCGANATAFLRVAKAMLEQGCC